MSDRWRFSGVLFSCLELIETHTAYSPFVPKILMGKVSGYQPPIFLLTLRLFFIKPRFVNDGKISLKVIQAFNRVTQQKLSSRVLATENRISRLIGTTEIA